MKFFLFIALLLLSFLTSCSKEQKELNISTNSWIGYTPLFYAKERGYLDKLNIHLITNVSLAEAADVYNVGKADMVTTTQHEYRALKRSTNNIFPIILLDSSNGGDMILSNKSIHELKNAQKIYAYLEIDSINAEILEEFLKYYKIDKKNIKFINKDQAQIQDLEADKQKNILIVTYVPYNVNLEKKGFKEIASTKEKADAIIVIDAICTNNKTIKREKERLLKLKKIIDRSIYEIEKDKKNSYKLVKNYLNNISYKDYTDALQLIKWINKPSEELLKRIEPMGYNKKQLIQ